MSNTLDTNTNLSAEEKRHLLAKLLAEKASRQPVERPLSQGQRSLWFMYQLDPKSSAYNVMYAAHIRRDADHTALEKAFQQLVSRHPVLRTTYSMKGGVPAQVIHPEGKFDLQRVDAQSWDWNELQDKIQQSADVPFDLAQGPVIRAEIFERAEGNNVLLMTAAHIALDFWAFDLLFDELDLLYREEVTGQPANLEPVKVDYTGFVKWQEKMLAGDEGERLWDYWRQQLEGNLPSLDLPTDRPRPPVQSFRGSSYQFRLDDELSRRLIDLSKAEGTTLFAMLLASFQILLHRYSGQQDILVGSPTAGRSRAEFEDILGYFLNPIVLRAEISPETSFQNFLAKTKEAVIGGVSHQDFPFPMLVERLSPPRDASRSPVFQVAFGWDKPRRLTDEPSDPSSSSGSQPADPGTLGLEPFALGQQGSAFDLMLMMLNIGDTVSAALQYNCDLFDESTVARMVDHFKTLLESIAADPSQPIADLATLGQSEQRMILEDWNSTASEYSRASCLHELFEAQAQRQPDSVAVDSNGKSLTYRQLDERSNQLAAHLISLGVKADTLVGLYVNRSADMLMGMLGILKAGGAYVPLSPGTPGDRLAYMLEESSAPVVLTEEHLAGDLPRLDATIVRLDSDWDTIAKNETASVGRRSKPEDLAYVIFTSGSTGKPKGVQIEHRTVVNFLESMAREPGMTGDDVLLAVTTMTFDISVLELFLPLSVGAKVVIVTRDVPADGIKLAEALSTSGATIMQATPATWRLLVEGNWAGDKNLKVLCGGEALPRDLANDLVPRCASLWNMYGPTETTIWSAVEPIEAGEGLISIGRPIANTQIYVLDQRMRPAPIGVTGDLYIGGDGLARGYLNRPELTAEKFIKDSIRLESGARIYKTGDLARFRADGKIDFLGRSDFQVKVRGYRIELGEIEAILHEHPAIKQAVVMARQMGPHDDDKQLIGYVISDAEVKPNVTELREFLRESLPDYMLPASFVWMDEFPLNPAGKVDRKALPEPDSSRPELRNEYIEPRNEIEEGLAEIWASILGVDQVGMNDNFFELGGASIQSLEIASLAKAELGLDISPAMLFQHPTIGELATAAPKVESTNADTETNSFDVAVEAEVTEPATTGEPASLVETTWKERNFHTLIESIGTYFPPKIMSSKEVLNGCKKKIWFPLEKMTGIKNRHVAGEEEFSFDLARKAVEECLAYSKYGVDDIDLLMCCNIVRTDSYFEISVEPNSSMRLKRHFGFKNAVAYDVTNACTGMFTCIMIAEAYLATGEARRAMIVSGEFITDIMRTAQKEISEFMDSRLACLTVGDAGAATIIEATDDMEKGFHELDMYTLGKYSDMCIGRLTDQPHGGAIMHVPNPMEHTSVAVKHSVAHAKYTMDRTEWEPERMDHLIMHQTSDRSIRDGKRAINKVYKKKICNDDNTINNLAERANTATTTHFVAMWDHILNGRIKSDENIVFGITGSGQSIGSGIYTLDDLPDRLRAYKERNQVPAKIKDSGAPRPEPPRPSRRVEMSSVATFTPTTDEESETIPMTVAAAEKCLDESGYDRNDIELLVFAGLYRTGAICEPAIATMITGGLKMNDDVQSQTDKKTLAFDVYNGSLAFLNACQIASQLVQAGRFRNAMVVASEVEQNSESFPERMIGLHVGASAVIFDHGNDPNVGFGKFEFAYHPEHFDARIGRGNYVDGKPCLSLDLDPKLHQHYLSCIGEPVEKLLKREGLDISQINLVLPPQFSSEFNHKLADMLGIAKEKVVDLKASPEDDLFSSALPFSIDHAKHQGLCKAGDIGLIINVGAGLQVGCATYYF
jgi:amino acid adenylation domain-containing protein